MADELEPISAETKALIAQAIDNSLGFAGCAYTYTAAGVRSGVINASGASASTVIGEYVAGCIVAQIAVLRGVTIEELSTWNGTVNSLFRLPPGFDDFKGVDKIRDIPLHLLRSLQWIWDGAGHYYSSSDNVEARADEAKQQMHTFLDNWPLEQSVAP